VVDGSEAAPHLLIVFGALGDLAKRKLIPAVYRLQSSGQLGARSAVLGVDTRVDFDDDTYRASLFAATTTEEADFSQWCGARIHYETVSESPTSYANLAARVTALETQHSLPGNRIFYLAVPLSAVVPVVRALVEHGLGSGPGWTRLVLEKPFGYDLASARALNEELHRHFNESALYRIDHYLGKETVQNLLALRFANSMFAHLWSSLHVSSVEITVTETVGVEARAQYYERSGVVRDMVQNHLCQLMCLVGMESPGTLDARDLRRAKSRFLEAVAPVDPSSSILGQYVEGVMEDVEVPGYRRENGVRIDSRTPTYAALRLEVDNDRWKGVPFFLKTGKRLASRHSHIALRFHNMDTSVFHPHEDSCGLRPNLLLITLQPDEGFDIRFQVKQPGYGYVLSSQLLRFKYGDVFGPLPDAYESLLQEVVAGDGAHFVCDTEIEAAWRVFQPLLDLGVEPSPYAAGSRGPVEADAIGAQWIDPEVFHP